MRLPVNQMTDTYKELNINLDKLGCIMLDTEPLKVSDLIKEDEVYVSADSDKFWIEGIVSENVPHVTLLYGLLQSGRTWMRHVDDALDGWEPTAVEVESVGFFESVHEQEPYYVLIAHLKLTDTLLEGNARLKMLPHIETFSDYKPHITLAYINQDAQLRDELLYALNNRFVGKTVNVVGVNYGKPE